MSKVSLDAFKEMLLGTGLFRKVSGEGQYVCKTCPYCGDMKNHMYVLIRFDDTPVLYKCFKCNNSGILDKTFLDYFGIESELPKIRKRKRIALPEGVNTNLEEIWHEDIHLDQKSYDYFKSRTKFGIDDKDMYTFQIVADPVKYAREYLGGDCKGFGNRIWFRCSNGTLIGRSLDDNNHLRWKKYSGDLKTDTKSIYVIKKAFDLAKPIDVVICEGVFDAIGLYYYFEYFEPINLDRANNTIYLACLGSDYMSCVRHLLNLGIFGDSVHIRIYKDADVKKVRIDRKLTRFFKSVNVYINTRWKDYGVDASRMEIARDMEVIDYGTE